MAVKILILTYCRRFFFQKHLTGLLMKMISVLRWILSLKTTNISWKINSSFWIIQESGSTTNQAKRYTSWLWVEARPKEVTSEERYIVVITTHYAYIHSQMHPWPGSSRKFSSHIFWWKKHDQFCYLRLYLALKLFHVVCWNGWQGRTWIVTCWAKC